MRREASAEWESALKLWYIGVIFLGASAEHVPGPVKQQLSGKVISLASSAAHYLTKQVMAVDVSHLKEMMASSEGGTARETNGDGAEKRSRSKRTISDVVDSMQHMLLTMPFCAMLDVLCEQARNRVLAGTIRKLELEGKVERVIHATWLTDFDVRRGIPVLNTNIKSLPRSCLLRMNLAHHLANRAYWTHSRKEDRLALLDIASKTLRPLGIEYPGKKELVQRISRE